MLRYAQNSAEQCEAKVLGKGSSLLRWLWVWLGLVLAWLWAGWVCFRFGFAGFLGKVERLGDGPPKQNIENPCNNIPFSGFVYIHLLRRRANEVVWMFFSHFYSLFSRYLDP